MEIVPYCETEGGMRFGCAQTGCGDCQEALLRENNSLIWVVIRKQWIGETDWDDLIQVGRIALWQAIRHYDPQRGVCFSTYACQAIRNQLWQAVAWDSKEVGWQEAAPRRDQIDELEAVWQAAQIHEALDEGLAQLSERQRQVIELYYGWGGDVPQKLSEIGQILGLSGERIRQIRNAALVLLRIPGLSIRLRSLYESSSRENYREALRQNREWQRKYRGRR